MVHPVHNRSAVYRAPRHVEILEHTGELGRLKSKHLACGVLRGVYVSGARQLRGARNDAGDRQIRGARACTASTNAAFQNRARSDAHMYWRLACRSMAL